MGSQFAPSRLSRRSFRVSAAKPGFTIPEVLVVVAVIALLIAVLLPALTGAKTSTNMAKSQSNLRQIATWMRSYSAENRDIILPSQFDYTASAVTYPVKVRSDAALGANRYKGTWTDILWTINGMASAEMPAMYTYDSPDKAWYDGNPTDDNNVLRSAAANSQDFVTSGGTPGTGPKPFGTGAVEGALPGYFAANNFFNATSNVWYTNGQIFAPVRSMYAVDSFAGETIEPAAAQFDNSQPASGPKTIEVDFRYSGACLMLFLDGHVGPQTAWTNLADLQSTRPVKIQSLDQP